MTTAHLVLVLVLVVLPRSRWRSTTGSVRPEEDLGLHLAVVAKTQLAAAIENFLVVDLPPWYWIAIEIVITLSFVVRGLLPANFLLANLAGVPLSW